MAPPVALRHERPTCGKATGGTSGLWLRVFSCSLLNGPEDVACVSTSSGAGHRRAVEYDVRRNRRPFGSLVNVEWRDRGHPRLADAARPGRPRLAGRGAGAGRRRRCVRPGPRRRPAGRVSPEIRPCRSRPRTARPCAAPVTARAGPHFSATWPSENELGLTRGARVTAVLMLRPTEPAGTSASAPHRRPVQLGNFPGCTHR